MKKQIIVLIIGFIFLSQACVEDEFLREEPRDDIFAENLFVNYDGFVNGLNAMYANVREQLDGTETINRKALFQMGVDNVFVNNGAGTTDPFNDYADLNSQNDIVDKTFERMYEIINSANLMINRAENSEVDWQGLNSEEDLINKNKVIAQAKLVRAFCYRNLRYGWGAVPLSLDEITGTTYRDDWGRTPVEKIQEQMEDDLLFARDNLDMVEETGTVNSAIASTILAELYLDMDRA
ncbi:MAG TPA: RagB/SusD family nutrient uptake outer membrane protein, partial [Bacteroidales bacterium]|nr:RagB/SusD family nutrient uptake outer membrane protein [Bacteroidales bacterium]